MADYAALMDDAYPALLELMIRLVDKKDKQKIEPGEEWRNDAQTLASKLFKHLVSMHNLFQGATVGRASGEQLFHIDHSSIIVIARAALETYLVWHYLYAQPDAELSRFRYLTWRLGGLMDRQGIQTVSQTGVEVQAKELIEVEKLRAKIVTLPQFRAFTDKQKKKLLEGDWKTAMGTADIASAAGFHGSYFRNVYGYLCGYSHASYISALQVGQAKSIEDQARLARSTMSIGLVTMAHFACSYPKQFPEALAVLNADPRAKALAEMLAFNAEDMKDIYRAPVDQG